MRVRLPLNSKAIRVYTLLDETKWRLLVRSTPSVERKLHPGEGGKDKPVFANYLGCNIILVYDLVACVCNSVRISSFWARYGYAMAPRMPRNIY